MSELFSVLAEDELCRVTPLCNELEGGEGEVIFTEGREAAQLYIVVEGKLALQKAIRAPHAKHPRRTTVTLCCSGQVAGWSALVPPYRYTLSGVGWEAYRLISINAALLRRELEARPVMGYKVMSALSIVISRRLKQTTDSLINEREVSFAGLKCQ